MWVISLILHNDRYKVSSNVEVKPSLERFDIVHNTERINTNDFFMAHIFQIDRSDGHSLTFAVVDLICSGYPHCVVLETNYLTLVLFRAIIRIDLETGSILKYENCENMGGLFEIYRVSGGYLIWGEGDVFRYDDSLNRIWHFMGRDILVSLHADKHFWIEDGQIHCRDMLGWHYILTLDGELIRNYQEFQPAEVLSVHSDPNG